MKSRLFLLLIILCSKISIAQAPLYGYKTYNDFFNNKRYFFCACKEITNDVKIKCVDTLTKTYFKANVADSNLAGYHYDSDNGIYTWGRMIYDNHEKAFLTYMGGTQKLFFMTYGGVRGRFNHEGELVQGNLTTYNDAAPFRFVKNLDFKNRKKELEDIIKDNPLLLSKYLAEKKALGKRSSFSDDVSLILKYVKLYNEDNNVIER